MTGENLSNRAATEFIAQQRAAGYSDSSILSIAQNDRDAGTLTEGAHSWVKQILVRRTRGGLARGADDVDHAGPKPPLQPLPLSSGPVTIDEEPRLIELLQGSAVWPVEWRNRWNGLGFNSRQRLAHEAGIKRGEGRVYDERIPEPEEGYDEVAESIASFQAGSGDFAGVRTVTPQYANGGILPKLAEHLIADAEAGRKYRAAASARYFPSQTPTPTMHDLSMRLRKAVVDLGAVLESLDGQADGRNLAMAKTALEDVQMRANRALHSPKSASRVYPPQVSAGIDVSKFVDIAVASAPMPRPERDADHVAGYDA